MPKPTERTNPTIIETTLRSVAEWYEEHKEPLSVELEEDYDVPSVATALADALQQKASDFAREGKETKAVITQRDVVISRTHDFERSVRASARRRLKKNKALTDETRSRVQSDFNLGAPSGVRSVQDALQRLNDLETALTVHTNALSVGRNRVPEWKETIGAFRTQFEEIAVEMGKEKQETSAARQARDLTRVEAVEFLDDLALAAEAIVIDAPEALNSLNILFDTHNPPSTPTRNDEDPDDDI